MSDVRATRPSNRRFGERLWAGTRLAAACEPGGASASVAQSVGVLRRGLAMGATLAAVLGTGAVALPVGSAVAAEERGFELVSPPDKAGNQIEDRYTVQASPDGNAVAFSSQGSFGDAGASLSGGYYVARRSAEGWATRGIDPPQRNAEGQIATPTIALSTDLTKAIQFSGLPLAPGAIDGRLGGGNLFFQDLSTGARTLAAASTDLVFKDNLAGFVTKNPIDTSSDFSHMIFQSSAQVLPEAAPGVVNAYEVVKGQDVRLVNILPDGTPDPAGGVPVAISPDGSHVFFTAASDGALYVRVNGTTTVPISVSQRAGDPPTPVTARFSGASKDRSIVFFMSLTPLTDDAPGGDGSVGDLYRYDLDTDTLSYMPVAVEPNAGWGVGRLNAVSDDGQTAFYTTSSIGNLNVSDHQGVRQIASLPFAEVNGPIYSSLSPSARYFAFLSFAKLTTSETTDPACRQYMDLYGNPDGSCVELYVYDKQTGSLACPACDPIDGRRRLATLGAGTGAGVLSGAYAGSKGIAAKAALDDGRVFFDTAARLVSEDTNGVIDVYMWDGQQSHLISSGRGSGNAKLATVSEDGRNVFFVTDQRLVDADVDGAVDLYDARVGGGLASQRAPGATVAPCEGDGCQGTPSLPGGMPAVATVDFAGAGDPTPARTSPSGAARVSSPKSVKGSRFVVTVKVPSTGKIAVSGARVRAAHRQVSKAGSYRLGVVLNARAKRQLRKVRRLKVAARVTFTTSSGVSSSSTLSVTLKA